MDRNENNCDVQKERMKSDRLANICEKNEPHG